MFYLLFFILNLDFFSVGMKQIQYLFFTSILLMHIINLIVNDSYM